MKGRRLGILMLGMMSWGALPLSIMAEDDGSRRASPAVLTAPLPKPPERDPSSELRREEEPLKPYADSDVPSRMGVMG